MAVCANTLALKAYEVEHEQRHRRAADWARAFDRALARFPEELGDGMLLEVVGELSEDDPDYDHDLALAFRSLSRVRAHKGSAAQLTACYLAIGQTVVDWIDHYSAQWAEREADAETGL